MATLLDANRRLQTMLPVTVVSGLSDLSRSTLIQSLREGKPEVGHWKLKCPEVLSLVPGVDTSDLQYRESLVQKLKTLEILPHWTHLLIELAPEVDNQMFCELLLDHSARNGRKLSLHSFVTAVDARQFARELFADEPFEPDAIDVADLLVAQVEFCDVLVVFHGEEAESKCEFPVAGTLRALQPRAHLVHWPRESDLNWLLHAPLYHPELTAMGCGWRRVFYDAMDHFDQPIDAKKITSSLVFRRRRPVHPERFHAFIDAWPDTILRTFGTVWLASQPETPFTLSQAAFNHFVFIPDGCWVAALHPSEIADSLALNPQAAKYWDKQHGDRCTELAFVGDGANADWLDALESCLLSDWEMRLDWSRFRDPFQGDLPGKTSEGKSPATLLPHPT